MTRSRPPWVLLLVALAGTACVEDRAVPSSTGSSPAAEPTASATPAASPNGGEEVVRVLALGDMGTGTRFQYAVAGQMCEHHDVEPVSLVVTTGDNVYQSGAPEDFQAKFLDPYKCLFDRGVPIRASLGNHDVATDAGAPELNEPAFGMDGRYYSFFAGPLRFVVLDADALDAEQLSWMRRRLRRARGAPWTVMVFHQPVHSEGTRHGSTPGFAELLGSPFEQLGVDLVLNGHEHLYERLRAGGVTYVVTGGGGAQLDFCRIPLPAQVDACLTALHYVELEATSKLLVLTAINQRGEVLDQARIGRNR